MRIGVVAKTRETDFAPRLVRALKWLQAKDCQLNVESEVVREFDLQSLGIEGVERESIPSRSDALVVFGGDGTLLAAARLVQQRDCPILGVNLGSLGFLTEVTLEELEPALANLLTGNYRVSRRCVLRVQIGSETFHALNDAVINKGALARIISLDAFSGEDFIANFLADGIIVSTPTGSTAYSLSAGGPIIFPSEDLIALTPICPHTLTNRTLIVPAESEIRIVLRSGDDVMVTVDGQVGVPMDEGDVMTCTKAPFTIQLIQPSQKNFFDILREKLKWGER